MTTCSKFVMLIYVTEFLQPYKARPETTAVVARRMLAGALGLKPKVSKEQREKEREEKHKLKEAKGTCSSSSQTCIKRSHLRQRKSVLLRQVTNQKIFNSYEIFYDRTRKR